MSSTASRAATAPTVFAPPSSSAELVAEALRATISGEPLPEGVRPAPAAPRPLATAREGIARMLGARAAG